MNHTLQFVPTTCTNTSHVNLNWWDEFSYFHVLITSSTKLKFYALETYPNLINFLYFLFFFRKEKGIPIVGLEPIALIYCKLGPRGAKPS
jgi:hypothetical protein